MATFNRIVIVCLVIVLLIGACILAAAPLATINQTNLLLGQLGAAMQTWQTENPTNFLIAQAAFGVSAVLLFGALLTLEFWVGRRRGVRIRTAEGGSAELDIKSIGRRLEWHLEQLAEIISVVPAVKSKGGSVNIKLEVETAPDVDVPMKTDEIVEVTRDIIEQEMGLRLGKLDVQMRYAPFEPDWVA